MLNVLPNDRHTVVLMARRVDALNEVASRIAEAGGRAVVMPVDVTRKDDVSAAPGRSRSTRASTVS